MRPQRGSVPPNLPCTGFGTKCGPCSSQGKTSGSLLVGSRRVVATTCMWYLHLVSRDSLTSPGMRILGGRLPGTALSSAWGCSLRSHRVVQAAADMTLILTVRITCPFSSTILNQKIPHYRTPWQIGGDFLLLSAVPRNSGWQGSSWSAPSLIGLICSQLPRTVGGLTFLWLPGSDRQGHEFSYLGGTT